MVTLHEVITFLVSMQISISSLQTHNVNRCGRSRHLARKLSLRRKRSSPNVYQDDARYGFRCCHLKNIWTAPLPPETELSQEEAEQSKDRKSGSAGMPRPISYAVFCLKKKKNNKDRRYTGSV